MSKINALAKFYSIAFLIVSRISVDEFMTSAIKNLKVIVKI